MLATAGVSPSRGWQAAGTGMHQRRSPAQAGTATIRNPNYWHCDINPNRKRGREWTHALAGASG